MIALKLKQLPDRQSEKMVILVSADLKAALSDYVRAYAKSYGAIVRLCLPEGAARFGGRTG
jgi:hypothetical protein